MLKELIFGTGNKAKIRQVQDVLGELNVKVIGVNELGVNIEIEEDGKTAQENARKKARTYAQAIGRTVFAMDNALYFKGVDDSDQPGLFVRRIGGKHASDEEMIENYSRFLEERGGQKEGWWEYAVSIAQPDGTSVEELITSPRLFVSRPSAKVVPGYPLESIQIEPESGKYISEMTEQEQAVFWQKKIGLPLSEFIKDNI